MSLQGSGTRPQDITGTTAAPEENGAAQLPADLQDERLIAGHGISGAVGAFTARLRSGDLGSVPVVVGLVIIWAVFQIANSSFLSSRNLVNLTLQTTSVGVIALGIVLVLLLGEIDLSVGSVSGVAAAVVGVTFVNKGWPIVASLVAAVALGVLIGLFYGLLYTRFGVPSFVITLAGLLGFLGLQLLVLGKDGTINLPYDSALVGFATRSFLSPAMAYALVALVVVAYALSRWQGRTARAAAGLSAAPNSVIAIKAAGLAIVLLIPIAVLNGDRGVSSMFLLFLALVVVTDLAVRRTRWGRSVFAVGGNVEAARRAGINVRMIYLTVFAACTTFAAVGGILAAARLVAVGQASGGTDVNLNAIASAVIGGTSLFGGRGSAYSALLGALVITSISNGLALLSLDSNVRYIVTAGVLLIAVTIDSLSRRSRQAHGRA
ncbi:MULTISPECIES: sugar ABC transporter permease [Kribbella]|jgi:ABC-type xylose transport system permease subunit|uniref:Xylose transport system permease protein XylH n=1 Tax=Kribbella pratensis TaxID=2512112 RepID=A0ABY2FMC3_9ACTN|nr:MULTISPECIES: sugar ABC transporter permease [Kribbella]TDW94280.1 D-xylose transport system permease protein [Kribbella pratensis]TDX02885.1 D-xylose transport system permease protein [Kribbella sp. VKM Ac-2566]